MPGNAHEVDLHLVDVDGDLADGLGGVGVEEDFVLAAQLADLLHGLDDADLVVDHHDGDEGGLLADGLLQVGHLDPALGVDRQVGDLEALGLQLAT